MLFEKLEEYDEEIIYVRKHMRNAVWSNDFIIDTGQSRTRTIMNLKEIRLYLTQLTTEQRAVYEKSIGAGVTGITVRRFG